VDDNVDERRKNEEGVKAAYDLARRVGQRG
jgi:hypothetical protein